MLRGLNVLAGLILTTTGLIGMCVTGLDNGWGVIAIIGIALLATDLYIEERTTNKDNR